LQVPAAHPGTSFTKSDIEAGPLVAVAESVGLVDALLLGEPLVEPLVEACVVVGGGTMPLLFSCG